MTPEKREEQFRKEFERRRSRQLAGIALVVFLLVSLLWKIGHPGFLLRELSRSAAAVLELVTIAAFLLFSALNWRCPACGRYLGPNINIRGCRKCGARLQ
jgi:di/tricarboxylate transporter